MRLRFSASQFLRHKEKQFAVALARPAQNLAELFKKARLFALEDSDKAINATGNDTPSLILITLRDYVSIQAPSFSDFARNHRKFLLYSDGTTDDYWPRWLTQRGYALRVVSVDPPKKGLRDDVPDPPRCILYFVDLGESK